MQAKKHTAHSDNLNRRNLGVVSQFVLWIALTLYLVTNQIAYQVSEAREGVVVAEVLNFDTWVLPLRHGEIIPSKPPLFHWLSALISKLSGNFNELSLRLPSLLGGLLIAFSSYLFCRKYLGNNIAQLSLSLLLTSYCFIQMSIDGRVDMLFCALVHCALFYFLEIFISGRQPKLKDQLVLGSFIGLSILTKGPLGLVLFIIGSFPLLLIRYKSNLLSLTNLKSWYLNLGILPLLIISVPWYVLAYMHGSDGFVSRQLFFENIARFVGNAGIPSKPFWFYFFHLFSQATVSILALIFLSYHYLMSYEKPKKLIEIDSSVLKSLLTQSLSILLFLSLASGKRRAYLLPILPHIAIISGILLNNYGLDKIKNFLLYLEPIPKLLLGLTIIIQIFKNFIPASSISKTSLLIGLRDLPMATSIGLIALAVTLLIVINKVSSDLKAHSSDNATKLSLYFTSLYFAIFLLLPAQFFLTKGYSHSYYQFAKDLKDINIAGEKITFIKKSRDESFDTLFFYYKDRMSLHDLNPPKEPGLYLSRLEWLQSQSTQFQSNCTTILHGGREKDSPERNLVLFRINNYNANP